MENKSTLEGKSTYELEKIRLRFQGLRGQTQGVAHMLGNHWVPEAEGTYAFSKPLLGNGGDHDTNTENS